MQNTCTECKKEFEVSEQEAKWKTKCKDCFSKNKNKSATITKVKLGNSPDSAFGMVFNNAWAACLEYTKTTDEFKKDFDGWFQFAWEKMIEKRKLKESELR